MSQMIRPGFALTTLWREIPHALGAAWPWLGLFMALRWAVAAIGLPQDALSQFGMWLLHVALASMIGASIYRRLNGPQNARTLLEDGLRLFAATLLLCAALAIILFIFALGLVLLTGILVAVSGYDPTGADPSEVSASVDALRASGAIWIVYFALAAAAVLILWVLARLSLFGAATIARREIVVFQSWAMTRDARFVVMAAFAAMVFLPGIIALMISAWAVSNFGASTSILIGGALTGIILLIGHMLAANLYDQLGKEN